MHQCYTLNMFINVNVSGGAESKFENRTSKFKMADPI